MKMKIDKQTIKDFKAVKRALKVFKDTKRLEAVKTVVIKHNKDVTININL
jgi:hypothetical protein